MFNSGTVKIPPLPVGQSRIPRTEAPIPAALKFSGPHAPGPDDIAQTLRPTLTPDAVRRCGFQGNFASGSLLGGSEDHWSTPPED